MTGIYPLRRAARLALPLLLAGSGAAVAHDGAHGLDAGTVLGWWTWDPVVLSLLALSGGLYLRGVRRMWRRAGGGRGIRRWQAGSFAAGWLTLVVAQISPLDRLSDLLFSAHMTQHELLMLIAAPLLVLGRPLGPMLGGMPRRLRSRAVRWSRSPVVLRAWHRATGPITVWLLHGLVLWIWHVPALYQAALESEAVHLFQHAGFLGTAALFWWVLVHGRYGRMGYGLAVLFVFTTALHSGALGALLTFAPRVWYPVYQERTSAWGLSPLEDQQLAGLLMWVPAGALLAVLALALFAAWLGELERRVARQEADRGLAPLAEGGPRGGPR